MKRGEGSEDDLGSIEEALTKMLPQESRRDKVKLAASQHDKLEVALVAEMVEVPGSNLCARC